MTTKKLLTGNEIIRQLPDFVLVNFSNQISQGLRSFPLAMIPQTPANILDSIKQGRAIFYVRFSNKRFSLLSSGILYPERKNNLEDPSITTVEFGSWIAHFQGERFGLFVLEGARKLSSIIFPGKRLIAVTHVDNMRAQKQIKKAGGILVATGPSAYLKTKEGLAAAVKIYDITDLLLGG